ncbi:MAG TPA: hypothetical protein DEP05_02735 [Betaproteobacteria bacterium]|nr:hypothetical protein [Betaproteobacteria bacterium]
MIREFHHLARFAAQRAAEEAAGGGRTHPVNGGAPSAALAVFAPRRGHPPQRPQPESNTRYV